MLAGITDESLPLELTTVEELIGLDNAKLFELEQHRTALRDFQTDKPNVYKENQVIPVRTLRHLGHGGWAQVDCVENAVTGAQMARKRFRLKRTQAKKLKQSFETEIASLKKLNGHQHIIRYLYSYETEQTLNILLSPVANCNLYEYLEEEEYEHELGNRNDILIQSLGCLASALAFMHQHRIRHKDVKSQNVLLYQHDGTTRIIVTDFGISFDFSSKDNSVTEGATHKTRKYCSPEVARDSPRGRKSDVYSLGCIYLEILTVLS
ncbi:kinase-like domain-containing protein, partial [Clohesyomyces aquaticus]